MKGMNSLNQFFSEIDCHYQCYNMGRRIYPIKHQAFVDFEETISPCKMPFLQHAWLAIVFWKNNNLTKDQNDTREQEQHVWFLKLPLDEQAKLNLAARDDFLRRLFEALGDYLSESSNGSSDKLHSLEKAMKDNPYGFQPKPEQMANFHAIVHKHFSLPASTFYQTTQEYLLSDTGFNEWNELGFQGFADIAARLDEHILNSKNKTNEQLIIEAIPHLPIEPFQVLSSCLENHIVSQKMTQTVYNRLTTELKEDDTTSYSAQWCIAAIRASSQTITPELQVKLLSIILTSTWKTDIEVLATLSGRSWTSISHPEILPEFLEALAITDVHHQGAFKAILSDLMFIPGMRATILQAFRSPERSQQLAQAIGTFFNSL
ncbi:MAG: DUF3549 family protein [Gammaproteobacteria bacterium]|nr:DUF3549 family protein [Gammaproteobacteria bacterium]